MNDYQRAKLTSYRAVVSVFDRYPDEVESVGALARSALWVREHLAQLSKAVEDQGKYVARGEAKAADRKALSDTAVPVAQALSAKSDEEGDLASADLYDFVPTDFLHDTEQDALDRAGITLDGANATDPAALSEYGADPDDVAALTVAYETFREALTEPRDAIAVRSAHTAIIERLVPLIGTHLRKRTDRLMAKYRATPFGTEYKTARTIVDP